MARSFVLNFLLEEAYSLNCIKSRRQANEIRNLLVFNMDRDFVFNYRLTEELIDKLMEDIKHLMKAPRRPRRGLSTKIKLLSALSFFASGSDARICGKNVNSFMSQPSFSRCLHEVVEALSHPSVVKKYIHFPQNYQERLKLKEKFFEKYRIPGVIGCIDGTYVTMVRPTENEERYYCRKGNHARNVLLITDADLNILHVDATYGGATHDSFIFTNSVIRDHLEELVNTGETVHLLGDSGYAQRPYLMVPVPNADQGSPEEYYNKLHATARNTVERAIGRLKARFRCLLVHRVLHYHPDMVAKIVIACCVLHNMCNRAGLPAPTMISHEQQLETQFRSAARGRSWGNETVSRETALGLSSRQGLINALWRAQRII